MARNYGVAIDLSKNELQNARLQNLAADPGSPVLGQVYFNTVTNKLRTYNGATWDEAGTGAGNVTGQASSVDDEIALFSSTTGKVIKRATTTGILKAASGVIAAATAGTDYVTNASTGAFTNKTIDANGTGNSITNIETADFAANVVDNDATLAANSATRLATQQAVKSYVDNNLAGLDWKDAVRVATTAAGTLATSFANGQTVDGVVLATNDRILIKDQAAGAENGIYIVTAGAPTRATDADLATEVWNSAVYVRLGTANAGTNWVNSNTTLPTLGSTALTYVLFKGQVEAAATTTSSGIIEIATAAEAEAKTDNVRAVSPLALASFPIKKTFTIGDAAATSFALTHSLNTTDVIVSVYKVSTGDEWYVDVTRNSVNQVTIVFATAPALNEYKVVVIG